MFLTNRQKPRCS